MYLAKKLLLITLLSFITLSSATGAQMQWQMLPATPRLPKAEMSGYAPINNIRIWYAVYGHGEPLILLHGGLANSNYWGNQIPELSKHYQVIVMDSRGHGRSTHDNKPYTYSLMSSDVLALMDFLHLKKAAIVGWSDGGIIGIDIAINHPERLTKLFAFGANTNPYGVIETAADSPTFKIMKIRAEHEYQELSSTPSQFPSFLEQIATMWTNEPNFTEKQLKSIALPVWIVDGDHDEGIKREHTEYIAAVIPNAGLLIQPQTSHFGFMQDPEQFNQAVLHFMQHTELNKMP
jgi:pimeloyl-ACP methyl ester carboxylesterase